MSRRSMKKRHRSWRRRHASKAWCLIYILQEAPYMPAHYVGQTRNIPAERLRWHFKELDRHKSSGRPLTPVKKWLDDLRKRGITPTVDVIDDNGIWDISEAVWIDRLLRDGHPLLNIASVIGANAEQPGCERPDHLWGWGELARMAAVVNAESD